MSQPLLIAQALKSILETIIVQINEFKIHEQDTLMFELRDKKVHFFADKIVPSYMIDAGLDIECGLAQAVIAVRKNLAPDGHLEYYGKVLGGGKYGKFLYTLPKPPRPVVAWVDDAEYRAQQLKVREQLAGGVTHINGEWMAPPVSYEDALTQCWAFQKLVNDAENAMEWAGFIKGGFSNQLNAMIAHIKPDVTKLLNEPAPVESWSAHNIPDHMNPNVEFPNGRPRC